MMSAGIQRNEGDSVGTITPCKTMREVAIVRVEYAVVVTGAMLIQCPRGTAKLPTKVVGAAGSDGVVQFTNEGMKRYLYPLNHEHNGSK